MPIRSNSAANMQSGTIDTQEILWHGELREGGWRDERNEIVELCDWGKKYGIHGFVRYASQQFRTALIFIPNL